jgi:hypothetical protein
MVEHLELEMMCGTEEMRVWVSKVEESMCEM